MTDDSSDNDIAEQRSQMWSSELDDDENPDETESSDSDISDTTDSKTGMSSDTAEDTKRALDTMDPSDSTEWDVDSIREVWNPNSIRLPDSIQEPFTTEYKRLDWLLEQAETDFDFTKDRYYKPLVIALGVQAIRECDSDEIVSLVEKMEQRELIKEQS